MGLIPEATFLHMEVSSAIDKTYRRFQGATVERLDEQSPRQCLERVRAAAQRIQARLRAHYDREREELFPRVERVIGPNSEEVELLLREQEVVLRAFGDFFDQLTEALLQGRGDERVQLSFLEGLFDEFVRRYENRREIERSFYQIHATILYPGGASTD